METDNSIKNEFNQAMLSVYEKANGTCDYRPTTFLQMVYDYGGLETTRRLLHSEELQSGLTTLWECGKLDLSMEVLVLQPRFRGLFTDEELKKAGERLKAYDYDNLFN